MLKVKYHYPGDPVTEALLLFGQEFLQQNPNRETVVGTVDDQGRMHDIARFPIEEAICDACNAEVTPIDPCALSLNRLYCWSCFGEYIRPHILKGG